MICSLSIFLSHLPMQLIAHSHKSVVPPQSSFERYPLSIMSKEVSRLYQIKNCTVSNLLREIVRPIHAMRDNLKFAFNSCSLTFEVGITVHPDLYAGLSPLNHISYEDIRLKQNI